MAHQIFLIFWMKLDSRKIKSDEAWFFLKKVLLSQEDPKMAQN